MDAAGKLENRKQKIINWFKDPYNLSLFLIIVFALAVRLYYFFSTYNQPIWWDEGDYLCMAKRWAFGYHFPFNVVRQILFPLILSVFLKISNSEFLPRIFMLFLSMVSVIATYYLGKEAFDKKVGLIAGFFMSIFYLNLFYTFRLLVDLPSLSFFTLSAFLFYRYFKYNSHSSLYWAAFFIGIGTLFKISTATLLFAVLFYVLATENLKALKKKELWISAIIFVLVLSPYIIWGFFQFGEFVITSAGAYNAPQQGVFFSNGFANIKSYLSLFPAYLSWPLLIIFILGLFSLAELFLGFDILLKNKNSKLKRDFFLLLILVIPLVVVCFSVSYTDDRYILNIFPVIFIFASSFILKTYNYLKDKKKKNLAIVLIIFFLLMVTFIQFKSANSLINGKKTSYLQVKEAGLWIKANSNPQDLVMTQSTPQIGYYSDREVIGFPKNPEEMDSLRMNNSNIKYFMISAFERHLNWTYSYAQERNLSLAQVYFMDSAKTQPAVVIYKL